MAGNSNLARANREKNDEFYTRLIDIEKELRYYRKHFKGKIVYCNCDNPFESNFFKYFVLNFNGLGLKKLIATCYKDKPYKAVVTKVYDATGDGGIDMLDVKELFLSGENELTELDGDGDFRSDECVELLKESDIVVTNPPFSLFREYVAQLIDYEKKFIVVGNKNAITYKEIFPLLKNNEMWMGNTRPSDFITPEGELSGKLAGLTRWFTNLDIKKHHEDLILVKKYNPEEYPKYDNYDAIEVSRVKDIPYDYDGIMGVPITFLDKYNPEQFEILGMTKTPLCFENQDEAKRIKKYSNVTQHGKDGKKSSGNKVNDNSTLILSTKPKDKVYYTTDEVDGYLVVQYARILIRNKHPKINTEVLYDAEGGEKSW